MCMPAKLGIALLIIGGLNWGIVGLGMVFGHMDWNLVHKVLMHTHVVEGIVYLLVGISAVKVMFGGCKCAKCKACMACTPTDAPKM